MSKTEYMSIGGRQQDLMFEGGQQIKYCDKYKYLGLNITQDGTRDMAIKERNTQGRKTIAALNGILWDQHILKTNKHRIYRSKKHKPTKAKYSN